MEYKILIKSNNGSSEYFKFYQVTSAEGDWSSKDKNETIEKMKELLTIYSLSEIELVIEVDVDVTIDIPELPEDVNQEIETE